MLGREIRIKLDGPGGNNQAFYPGATIRGVVTYKASANDRLQSVNIDVRGVTKVLNTKKSPINTPEHIELFHLGEHLLLEPLYSEHRQLTWSFTFQLPTLTAPDRSNHDRFYGDGSHDELFDTLPHTLPPSLGADQSDEVRVEYPMYAVAKRHAQGWVGATNEIPQQVEVYNIDSLKCCPDPPEIAGPIPIEEKTYALGVGNGKQRRFSIKRSSTNNSMDDGAPLGLLVVKVPHRIVLGQPIPVSFIVRSTSNNGEPTKNYFLKSHTATLQASTHRRTAKISHKAALTETRAKKLGSDTNRNYAPLSSTPTSYSFPTDGIKDWPPTFRSYSIARTYELILDAIVLSCEGKEKREEVAHFEVEVEVVQKIAHGEQERRRDDAPPEFTSEISVQEVDLEPPPYERYADGRWIGGQWVRIERLS